MSFLSPRLTDSNHPCRYQGKTAYLYIKIIESLIKRRSFLYQTRNGGVYYAAEKGVEAVQQWSSKEPIMAFFDCDNDDENCEPKSCLVHSSVQIIVATPSKRRISTMVNASHVNCDNPYQTFNQPMVGPRAFHNWVGLGIFYFNPRLIHFFRVFVHIYDVTSKLLGESILYFGCNPRRCFDASYSRARLKARKSEVGQVITNLASESSKILRVLYDRQANVDEMSHTVFELMPTDEFRQFETFQRILVSPWVTETLMKACERKEAGLAAQIYRKLSESPILGMSRGHLFEKLAQMSLDDIKFDTNLKIRGLTDPNQTNWVYYGPIPRSCFNQSKVIAKINDAIKKNVHLVPLSPNFNAVDSIVYHPVDPILTCLQVTMDREHAIFVFGSPADPKVARTSFTVCKAPAQ